jgi:DNA-directed RNA polymerase subunit alpha
MLISQRPTLAEESVVDTRSRFVIEPLEPGFGYTLGNSLRARCCPPSGARLSPASASTACLHEFTTVPGRQGGRHRHHPQPQGAGRQLRGGRAGDDVLRKQGPGAVTAATSCRPPGSPVHNPDLHIATRTTRAGSRSSWSSARPRLRAGHAEQGHRRRDRPHPGRLDLLAGLKVTYKVEATRVEQRTDFDKLVLDVETKPSITPRDALASAGKTLVELFGLARELNVDAEGIEIGPSPQEADTIAAFAMPIEELDLTVRSYNCLKREGIHTVGELVGRSEADLLDIRNFGRSRSTRSR